MRKITMILLTALVGVSTMFLGCATVTYVAPDDALQISIGDTVEKLSVLGEADNGTGSLVENTRDYLIVDAYLEGSAGLGYFKSGTYTKTVPIVIQFNKGKIVNIYNAEYLYRERQEWVAPSGPNPGYYKTVKDPNPYGARLIPVQGSTLKINVINIDWAADIEDAADIVFGRMRRQ